MMKISQLDAAKLLRRNLIELRAMQDAASGFPRFDGVLSIGREQWTLPHAEVDRLLAMRKAELDARAVELGVEVDE
jgi:hypothetical protein